MGKLLFKVVRTKIKKKVKDCNEAENVHKKWLVKFHLDKYKVMYMEGKVHKTSHAK